MLDYCIAAVENVKHGEFPGDLVVGTQRSHCHGPRSIPGREELRSHKPRGTAKEKKKKVEHEVSVETWERAS